MLVCFQSSVDGDYLGHQGRDRARTAARRFRIEACMGWYGHPSYWRRSTRGNEGGAFFDWALTLWIGFVRTCASRSHEKYRGHFQVKRIVHEM
jgi:hypothetical protein